MAIETGKWNKLELVIDLNTDWTKPIIALIDQLKALLTAIETIIEAILNTLLLAADALVEALKAIIALIKETIEGLLEDISLYILVVPIRKRFMSNFYKSTDLTPPAWGGNSGTSLFSEEFNIRAKKDEKLSSFLVDVNRYNGGNHGFFRTVLESLHDPGDLSRPQFTSPNDYVGGAVFLMGTNLDPFGLLDDLWSFLSLFGGLIKDSGVRKIPKPGGLKAQVIAAPPSGAQLAKVGKMSVLLTWNPLEIGQTRIADFGDIYLKPDRYAIIRIKNDPSCGRASNVVDLMGTRELTQGLKFQNAEVIVESEFSIASVSYVDADVPTTKEDSFSYAVAWKLKGSGRLTAISDLYEDVEIGYFYLSNVVRVTPYPKYPASTPPDWIRSPTLEELLPEFGYLLRKFVMYIEEFADKIVSNVDYYKQYIQLLKNEVDRYAALAQYILDQLKKLLALFNLPNITGGLYMRTFFGQGGNDFFLRDLGSSLSPSFEDAPPFTKGDEYVTGLVILSGGPQFVVEPAMALINLLWGGAVSNPLMDSIANLGQQLDSYSTAFDDQFKQIEAGSVAAKTASDNIHDIVDCEHNSQPTQVPNFNEDMSVRSVTPGIPIKPALSG